MAEFRDSDTDALPEGLAADPGGGALPPLEESLAPAPAPSKAGPWGRRGAIAALALVALVDLVAGAGLLLRDRLEGRHPSTPEEQVFAPVAEMPAPSQEARESAVGFGVTQVVVGTALASPAEAVEAAAAPRETTHPTPAAREEPAGSPHPAPHEAAQAAPAAHPAPKAEKGRDPYAVAAAAPPASAAPAAAHASAPPASSHKSPPAKATAPEKVSAKAASPEKAAPSPPAVTEKKAAPKPAEPSAGGYGVAVGLFRSQKSVLEAEEKLKKLGFSTFRKAQKMRGQGIRIRVASQDSQRAAAAVEALRGVGYAVNQEEGASYVYVLFDDEAEQVAQLIRGAGAEAMRVDVEGNLPAWKVFAGPMSRAEAAKAAKRIKASGMDCFVAEVSP